MEPVCVEHIGVSRQCGATHLSARLIAIIVAFAAVASGCGGSDAGGLDGSEAACVEAWNSHLDEAKRKRVAEETSWQVEVTTWIVNHPAPDITGEGCSYVFVTTERWLSFSGARKNDGSFEWTPALTQGGLRTPEQRFRLSGFEVQPDGSLR